MYNLYGRKLYLTVNTLMKEQEMGELFEYLLPYYERGLDAVIVQDLGYSILSGSSFRIFNPCQYPDDDYGSS